MIGFGKVWCNLLGEIMSLGTKSAPRGKEITELCGVQITLPDMQDNILVHPDRNMNYRFMVAEWIWIALGCDDVASLVKYNQKMRAFSDDNKTLAGAYGPRLATQWDWVLSLLRKDPDTRQAIAQIWTPAPKPSKDIPCTLGFQYLIRGGKLNCIATMRSSDIWLGLPYDVFTFSMLAMGLAGELGIKPGWLTLNLGSSHLYSEHIIAAHQVIANAEHIATIRSPQLPCRPFVGLQPDEPWNQYDRVLRGKSSMEALGILQTMEVVK